MDQQPTKQIRIHQKCDTRSEEGFALATAVIVGFIVGLGALALAIRGSSALIGSIRQQQSKEALAVAEAGTESILGILNTRYPYLLANNYQPPQGITWNPPTYIPANVCRNMASTNYANMPTFGSVADKGGQTVGNWRIVSYSYNGNYYFGGTGRLRIEGTRLKPNAATPLSRAQIEQEFSVKYKECTPKALNAIALLGETVNVGATAVTEAGTNIPGNVLCTSCTSTSQMNISASAIGNWLYGPFPLPGVPAFPSELSGWDISLNPAEISKNPASAQVRAGQSRTESGKQVCKVDSEGVTHCRISSIRLNGSDAATLKIVYPNNTAVKREVRLYTEGEVGLGGNASVCQAIDNGTSDPPCISDPTRHGLTTMDLQWFGNPSCSSQDVKFNGGGHALNMFAYFPCGAVNVAGGSTEPDIRGAVWTKSYNSSGSNVQIHAPPDLLAELQKRYGSQFSLSLKRPVAIGVNRWRSFEQVKP
jgi:hypothetical protein